MHLSYADLPLISDFDDLKEDLDMVSKSFVTRSKPLIRENMNIKLHIRDTTLLSPSPNMGLDKIGLLYGDGFRKIDPLGEWKR